LREPVRKRGSRFAARAAVDEVDLILDSPRLCAMTNAPEPVFGERERRTQDDLGTLLCRRCRAFRDLGLVTDVHGDGGERQLDRLERIALLRRPPALGGAA